MRYKKGLSVKNVRNEVVVIRNLLMTKAIPNKNEEYNVDNNDE